MGRLADRKVLITGASSGIGAAVARAVAEEGGRIALLARDSAALATVAGETGGVAVPADLHDHDAAQQAVRAAARRLGGLDALVNNAGTFRLGLVGDGLVADWRDMIETNVLGLLSATQAAIPFLADSGTGQILNISSMAGRRVARPAQGVYAGTKHAVHGISDALRREVFEQGIRVTVLAPGLVHTNLGGYITDPEVRETMETGQREKGLDPRDVAAQVLHVLAAPRDVHLVEIALISSRQAPG